MNLRLILALAAFLGVAACGDAKAPGNSARTAIAPAKPAAAPAQTAAAPGPLAGCPKAPEPKCPTVKGAKAASTTGLHHRRSAKRTAVALRPAPREAGDGLPKRPYRYSELRRDRYEEPPVGLDDGDQLARRSWSERSHSYREGRAYEDEHRGPCCEPIRPQAAGFDANGFLTWPGKIPARP